MKSEVMRIGHELQAQKDKIKENTEKIKVNKTLPYLVSNVIEVGEKIVQDREVSPKGSEFQPGTRLCGVPG